MQWAWVTVVDGPKAANDPVFPVEAPKPVVDQLAIRRREREEAHRAMLTGQILDSIKHLK